MADIVAVGAHPDDAEIGMGATLAALAARGADVLVVDLTDGEPTPRGDHDTRMREAALAAEALGVRRLTMGLTNRELLDDVESRTALATVLRQETPRLLFAPYPVDAHPDHVAASSIVQAARFYAKFVVTEMPGSPHYPSRLYHYWSVHLRTVERPSFVADASEHISAKMAALAAYESQFSFNEINSGVLASIEGAARFWGGLIGTGAGEPFFCTEQLGVRDLRDLL